MAKSDADAVRHRQSRDPLYPEANISDLGRADKMNPNDDGM
jgi:hypothetical protein